ncbi:MAG: dihydropteroate synthase [Muribaculaceae bacterium]|nr:dihydropteroate synthase [Muribaculaceae bacterium]
MWKFRPFSLNIKGDLRVFNRPQVMGILNITPDSFYAQSRSTTECDIVQRINTMISQGVDLIDIGAYSSRPGAKDVNPDEECRRLEMGMRILRDIDPSILVSVDTFRATVAREAVTNMGVNIINDISGGDLDSKMFETVADLNVPYIVMHMRGTPSNMNQHTQYIDVTAEVIHDLSEKVNTLALMGVCDVIIDPGFGFSKTLAQNYEMMRNIEVFNTLERPLLVGISRKSMIYNLLGTTPQKSLNATSVLNTIATMGGASILRVHDVKEAVETIKITTTTFNQYNSTQQ